MALHSAEGWYAAMERGEARAGDYVTGNVVMDAMDALPPVRMGTNIVYAENERAIADSKYGRYAWYSVSEPGQTHDLDAYKRRGMPVVEV